MAKSDISITLNVLAQLICMGEATDTLLEHLAIRGIVPAKKSRELDLFDKTPGAPLLAETHDFLECSYDELFITRDKAFKRIFNWAKGRGGKDCKLSCSMQSDGSRVAFKLHVELEDRSILRIRMVFCMKDPARPSFLKCECRLMRSNGQHFLSPFEVSSGLAQAPTAFLQCIRSCPEYPMISEHVETVLGQGFAKRLAELSKDSAGSWEDEEYVDYDVDGKETRTIVRTATFGSDRYECYPGEKGDVRMVLRCGKRFKCFHAHREGSDPALECAVYGDTLANIALKPNAKQKAKETAAAKPKAPKISNGEAKGAKQAAPKQTAPIGKRKEAEEQLSFEMESTPKRPAGSIREPSKRPSGKAIAPSRRSVKVSEKDVLVRLETSNYEHFGHKVERVDAVVDVVGRYGRVSEKGFTAYYCPKCRKYYISTTAYGMLKESGFICCQVVEQREIAKDGSIIEKGSGRRSLKQESILHRYGYNVGQKDSLSAGERQTILSFVVEKGVIKPADAIGFLEYLIDNARRQLNKDMSNAIRNWEDDIRYLRKLNSSGKKAR